MVLSYLASYVYATPSTSGSSGNNNINDSGPQPTRANSIRRTTGGASSRYGNTSTSSSRYGPSRFSSSPTIPEESSGEPGSDYHPEFQLPTDDPALAVIHHINTAKSFYDVLGVPRSFKTNEDLRRAYMARCRVCHPE